MSEAVSGKKRSPILDLLIEVPAVIVTFVMMIHITANALLRTWWQAPINNTLEMVQYWYLPLVAFLGFIAAQYRGQHIAADLIFQMLPHVTRRFVLAAMFVLCAAVSLGAAWYGYGEAVHAMEIRKTAGVSDLISWPTYFLAPIAFGSLTLQFLYAAWQAVFRPERVQLAGDADEAMLRDSLTQHDDGNERKHTSDER